MRDPFIAGLMVLLVGWAASRLVQERALSTLDAEAKAALLDRMSALRKFSPIFVILLVATVYAVPTLFVPLLLAYLVLLFSLTWHRLRDLDLPSSFTRLYWSGQAILGVALVGYLAVIQGWVSVPS